MKVQKEYEKLKELFKDIDEDQLELIDGLLIEAARSKVELDILHEIVKVTGRIKINPNNPLQQKELPASKMLDKLRPGYLNYIAKLSSILGKKIVVDDDEELEAYE